MSGRNDPSINQEPDDDPCARDRDPSEDKAQRMFAGPPDLQELARTGQSVFDEPDIHSTVNPEIIQQDWSCRHCDYNLRGLPVGHPCPECGNVDFYRPPPAAGESYQNWLRQRIGRLSPTTGWYVATLAVLLGGPWAILATLIGTQSQRSAAQLSMLVAVVVIGPAAEEIMKIAAAAFVIEQRPYLYQREAQLIFSTAGSAFVFAAIENFIYLNFYFAAAPLSMVLWRWTVCVILHVGCTLIASRGLVRVWRQAIREYRRPRITRALPMITWAIVIHGAYNACAFFYEWARG